METDGLGQLYRQLVERARDAIVVADRDGIIRLWNAGAEEIFGYRADEAVGQTLDLIIPEHLRARHWEGYRRAVAAGATRYGRDLLKVPAVRRDGARLSLEFTVVLLREDGGQVAGVGAIIRDVTARWHEDRQLRRRLAELEAEVRRASGA
ncbi:MAG TPA: PAS domain S-box protein [Chloroflexota bacterium]